MNLITCAAVIAEGWAIGRGVISPCGPPPSPFHLSAPSSLSAASLDLQRFVLGLASTDTVLVGLQPKLALALRKLRLVHPRIVDLLNIPNVTRECVRARSRFHLSRIVAHRNCVFDDMNGALTGCGRWLNFLRTQILKTLMWSGPPPSYLLLGGE